MTPQRREKWLLIGLSLAVAVELSWVAHQVRTEVLQPEARAEGNPTTFTNNVIEAANK